MWREVLFGTRHERDGSEDKPRAALAGHVLRRGNFYACVTARHVATLRQRCCQIAWPPTTLLASSPQLLMLQRGKHGRVRLGQIGDDLESPAVQLGLPRDTQVLTDGSSFDLDYP